MSRRAFGLATGLEKKACCKIVYREEAISARKDVAILSAERQKHHAVGRDTPVRRLFNSSLPIRKWVAKIYSTSFLVFLRAHGFLHLSTAGVLTRSGSTGVSDAVMT